VEEEMKPFDLKAALNGAPVVTRDGEPVPWLRHDPDANPRYRVLARIEGQSAARHYSENGRFYRDGTESFLDLFMAPTKRTVWGALYQVSLESCPYCVVFANEETRDQWAKDSGCRILSLFEHTYEEPSDK